MQSAWPIGHAFKEEPPHEPDSSIRQSLLPRPLFRCLLFLGWAIGARWGHSATTGYAVFWAIATLLIHDVAMTVVAEQRTDWREVGPTPFG